MAMGLIDGIDFSELESERYWSFPKSYKKDIKTEIKNMIFSNEYLGSRKVDGAYYRFIKDMEGNMKLQGRNRGVSGDFLNKIGHVPQLNKLFELLPNGTCLLGELFFAGNEGSSKVTTVMGCLEAKAIQRQEAGEKLHYYIFDVWALSGLSLMKTTFDERAEILGLMEKNYTKKYIEQGETLYAQFAKHYSGKDLWELLQKTLADGYEGIVISKISSLPEPGKRTSRKTLKIKKELAETLDVVILDKNLPTRLYNGKEIEGWKFWENIRTGEKIKGELYKDYQNGSPIEPVTKAYFNDWAGSLIIGLYDPEKDKLITIGNISGLTDEVLENWKEYKGKILEVGGMELLRDKKGNFTGIRHPKAIRFRDDKTIKDCEIGQLK